MIKIKVNPWRRCNLQYLFDQRFNRYHFTPVQQHQNGHQIQLGTPKLGLRVLNPAVDDGHSKEMNNGFIS